MKKKTQAQETSKKHEGIFLQLTHIILNLALVYIYGVEGAEKANVERCTVWVDFLLKNKNISRNENTAMGIHARSLKINIRANGFGCQKFLGCSSLAAYSMCVSVRICAVCSAHTDRECFFK